MKKIRTLEGVRENPPLTKWIRTMKLTCLLITFALIQVSAETYSQTKKLTLNLKDAPLAVLFEEIEKTSEFNFFYDNSGLDLSQKVTVTVEDSNIETVLDMLFTDSDISYEISDRYIILKSKEGENIRERFFAQQQQGSVSGKVTDQSGLSLPGVTVVVKGTTTGTVTNADGNFTLVIPDGAETLQFSFVGMRTQELPIDGRTTFTVVMEEETIGMDEVVVVGYGTQKRINLTGAVSHLSGEELLDRPVTNITQALQGTIPNLNIITGTGQPGTSGSLNIRGNTSITGAGSPLVLIDGIPGEIDRVSINDVESITVLKDASASAIYGARAPFGVILITTKTAKEGEVSVTYNNNFGWTTHSTNTEFLNVGYDNLRLNEDFYYNALGTYWSGYSEEDWNELYLRRNDKTEHPDRPWIMIKQDSQGRDIYKYYGNFDWFNYFYNKFRPKQNHNISVRGGTDIFKYAISASTNREQGIWNHNPDIFKKNNLRSKVDIKVFPWLTVSNNTAFFNSNYTHYGQEDQFITATSGGHSSHLYFNSPAFLPRNPDGTYTYLYENGLYRIANGVHIALEDGRNKGSNSVNDFTTTFEANVQVLDGLSITGNYTYNLENTEDMYRAVRLQYSLYPGEVEQVPLAEWDRDILKETVQNNKYEVINIFGNYQKSFNYHNINLTAGFNQEEKKYKRIYAEGQELLSETLNDLNLTSGDQQIRGGASEWALRGYFYRFNYDYQGKYLFETSGRYDGTSRFQKGQRFGFFPSFSLGWRISEEIFFEPLTDVINNLKLRGSFGSLGNQQVSTYAYISSMSSSTLSYLSEGQRLRGVRAPSPVSPLLTWEKSTTSNIGIDFDILKQRLSVVFDAYIRNTEGMLVPGKTLPAVFGASEPRENAADLRTKGFEIGINWHDRFDLGNSPFAYKIGLILSDYTAEITKFDNPSKLIDDYYEGMQLGEIWGFIYDGFFKTTEEAQAYPVNQDLINKRRVRAPTAELRMLQAGDIKILDLDGDGEINFGANTVDNPGDRQIIGNNQPRYSFGVPISASWNGIDINILFQGIGRQHWYPHLESQMFWHAYARPYSAFVPVDFENKIWRPDNPNAYFPRPIGYIAQNSELSQENNMYLQDLAFMKLRNLTVGYTIPSRFSNLIGLNYVRIYTSGENLFTWTKLETDYIDPEEVMLDVTGRTYPMGKTFSCGLEIRF